MWIFISLFLSLPLLAVELIGKDKKYFLKGSCEETRLEIAYFSNAPVECICDNDSCLTEITTHLSPEIQDLLAIRKTQHDGPNCWNSVLFSLKVHQGLHFSNSEMVFWLSSPLCERRSGPPVPGDLINVIGFTPERSVEQWHTYRMLSPEIAFNKSSPDKNDPYELRTPSSYLDENQIPSECRFVSVGKAQENKCEMSVQAYSCRNLNSVLESLDESKKGKEIRKDLKELSDCSQRVTVTSESLPLKDLENASKIVSSLALQELHVPTVSQTPREISELLLAYLKESCQTEDCDPVKSDDWKEFIPLLYFYSSPEMNLDNFGENFRKVIQRARELKLYSNLPLKDRLMWINAYLTGNSLSVQFKELQHPETDEQ